jgi:hypothetical protein
MQDLWAHEMQFKGIHTSGAQEWRCPTCGRRLLMQWPPSFEKQVLEPGDTNAFHTGGKVGSASHPVSMDARSESVLSTLPQADTSDIAAPASPDTLRPWLKWARDAGIDDVWDHATGS